METRISPVIPHSSFYVEQALHMPVFLLVTKLDFAHSSVVWGRGQQRDAQGHPYHCSIQMGAKEKTRREGFSPPNMRMGNSGVALLPQPLLLLTQLLFSLSQLPFTMHGAQHSLLSHIEKETRKLNATLSYCVVQSGCCTAQHHSLLCTRRLRSAMA